MQALYSLLQRLRVRKWSVCRLCTTFQLLQLSVFECADEQYAPSPSAADQRLAEESRGIKVYVYDFAAAGFAPHLNATDARSPACDCAPSQANPGIWQDPCNTGLGRLHSRAFAAPFQGNYWGNFRGGQDNMKTARARLESGYRRVDDPGDAQLFFIPLEIYDTCMADKRKMQAINRECGIDYRKHSDFVAMWRWLLQQDAFAASDGSDHFLFTEFPFKAGQRSYLHTSVRLRQPVTLHVCRTIVR